MKNRELMQMALTHLEHSIGISDESQKRLSELKKALRDRLAQPEPTGREIQKIRQSAWKAVSNQYKDDPECCFALGWEAGYGAVAPKVEPPETESGEGFESLPAPSIKQPEHVHASDISQERVDETAKDRHEFECPRCGHCCQQREWVGLTEQDAHDAFQFTELVKQLSFDRDRPEWCENFAAYIEAKLKEKNT